MNKKYCLNNSLGFTLSEAVVVIIVLASFMFMAIPRFSTLVERLKVQEQTIILQSVHGSALEYFQDQDVFASSLDELDVNIPQSTSFTLPDVSKIDEPSPSTFICDGVALIWLAAADRIDGEYTLFITEEGEVYCDPCDGICTKLGFSDDWL